MNPLAEKSTHCTESHHSFPDYLPQLASNLLALECINNHEGQKQFWELYGHRECLQALHLSEHHHVPLPPPNCQIVPPDDLEINLLRQLQENNNIAHQANIREGINLVRQRHYQHHPEQR